MLKAGSPHEEPSNLSLSPISPSPTKHRNLQRKNVKLPKEFSTLNSGFWIGKLYAHPLGFLTHDLTLHPFLCEEEMPFMSKLIGTQPNEDATLLVQCPTYNK